LPCLTYILRCELQHFLFALAWLLPLSAAIYLTLTISPRLWAGYRKAGRCTRIMFWLGVFLLLSGAALFSHHYADSTGMGF